MKIPGHYLIGVEAFNTEDQVRELVARILQRAIPGRALTFELLFVSGPTITFRRGKQKFQENSWIFTLMELNTQATLDYVFDAFKQELSGDILFVEERYINVTC